MAGIFSEELILQKLNWESWCGWFKRIIFQLLSVFFCGFYVCVFLSTPFLAYLDFGFMNLDTDYWTVRYIYTGIYLLCRHAPYLAVDDMKTLIADGVLLPQIISIYMFNEISLELMVIIVLPVLIWLNRKFALQIMIFQKEPTIKTTFVRLLGQHDTIFLILIFSLMVGITNLLDAITFNWLYTLNLTYIIFILYVFQRLMEEKQQKLANSFLAGIVIVFSIFFIVLYLSVLAVCAHELPKPVRNYPLFKPKPTLIIGPLAEDDPMIEQLNAVWERHNRTYFFFFHYLWSLCRFDGVWAFKNWVFLPTIDWVFRPFCRFTGLTALYDFLIRPFVRWIYYSSIWIISSPMHITRGLWSLGKRLVVGQAAEVATEVAAEL